MRRLTDAAGKTVPDHLADVFRCSTFRKYSRSLREYADFLFKANWNTYIQASWIGRLRALSQEIADAQPFLICTDCNGDGCITCRQFGWLPRRHRICQEFLAETIKHKPQRFYYPPSQL